MTTALLAGEHPDEQAGIAIRQLVGAPAEVGADFIARLELSSFAALRETLAGLTPGELERARALLRRSLSVTTDLQQLALSAPGESIGEGLSDWHLLDEVAQALAILSIAAVLRGLPGYELALEQFEALSSTARDATNGYAARIRSATRIAPGAHSRRGAREEGTVCMPDSSNSVPISIFSRDPGDPRVLVADGYGLSLSVSRGHLLVRDGLGRHRRERTLPRAQRTVRRIVILGHTGHLTLEAVRWCADTGIALIQLDTDGTILLTAGKNGTDDARLRRAQAAAAGSDVGVALARALLTHKIRGQADVAETDLAQPVAALRLRELVGRVQTLGLVEARELEAQASNNYFAAWHRVVCKFAARDADRVPQAWRRFTARREPFPVQCRAPSHGRVVWCQHRGSIRTSCVSGRSAWSRRPGSRIVSCR